MTIAQQTAEIVNGLPPQKAEAALSFVRYLASESANEAFDAALDNAAELPKFRRFVEEARERIARGEVTPLDETTL